MSNSFAFWALLGETALLGREAVTLFSFLAGFLLLNAFWAIIGPKGVRAFFGVCVWRAAFLRFAFLRAKIALVEGWHV